MSQQERDESTDYTGIHLNLNRLRRVAQDTKMYKNYLYKENIPTYPGPMGYLPEFKVSHLKHETFKLEDIKNDEGFKDPNSSSEDPNRLSLVWWSLAVAPEEIQSAEETLLKETFPNFTMEHPSFLWKFASSPALSEKSMYGSYRFTFPVKKVLETYSKQCCNGEPPVMRVLKTCLYKQEVVYAVLVHSPETNESFSEYPKLSDGPNTVCTYKDGCFIWRPQAMCKTHSYELIERYTENLMDAKVIENPQFYVWDQVAIALHVEGQKGLKFDSDDLRENLTFCDAEDKPVPKAKFDNYKKAESLVTRLWPNGPSSLKKEVSLQQKIQALKTQQ